MDHLNLLRALASSELAGGHVEMRTGLGLASVLVQETEEVGEDAARAECLLGELMFDTEVLYSQPDRLRTEAHAGRGEGDGEETSMGASRGSEAVRPLY